MDFDYVVLPALIVLAAAAGIWITIRRIRSGGRSSHSRWRKLVERIVLSLVILILAVAGTSSGYNAIALYIDRHPAPGKIYSVDGYPMRLDCTGIGSPTVILETGGGGTGLGWAGVQPTLAKTTRVCSYDRAGMGWSDTQPGPRDANHVATQLHALLGAAGIQGPLVLVGASLGGPFIREYASRYPSEVVGLVFVDARPPLLGRNPIVKAYDSRTAVSPLRIFLARAEFILGIPRLRGRCSGPIQGLGADTALSRHADECHQSFDEGKAETEAISLSDSEAEHTGPYGNMPILILSADIQTQASRGWPRDLLKIGDQLQEDMKNLSTRSLRIIAKGSGHGITGERPDLVEKEIPLFVERIRGTVPPPTDYGATVTE